MIDWAVSIMGTKRSVAKMESTPWSTGRIRSSPAPVSMLGRGRGSVEPSSLRLYCMNTRFQISTNRSDPPKAGPPSSP